MNEKNIDYGKLEQMVTEGNSVDDICAEFGISSGTFYNRKNSDEEWKAAIDKGKQRRRGVAASAPNGQVELPDDEKEVLRIVEGKVIEAIGAGNNLKRAIHGALEAYSPGKVGQAISGLVASREVVERQCGAVTAYFIKGSAPPATSKLVMNGKGGIDVVDSTNGQPYAAPAAKSEDADHDLAQTPAMVDHDEEEDPLEIIDESEERASEAPIDQAEISNGPDREETQGNYCGNCGRPILGTGLLDLGVEGCDGVQCLTAETPGVTAEGARQFIQDVGAAAEAGELENPVQEPPPTPFDLLAQKEIPVENFSEKRQKQEKEEEAAAPPRGRDPEEAEASRRREYDKRAEYYQDTPKRTKGLFEHLFGEGTGMGSGAFFPLAALMSAVPPALSTVIKLKSGRLVIDFNGNFFREDALGRDLLCAIAEVVEAHEAQSRAAENPPERVKETDAAA